MIFLSLFGLIVNGIAWKKGFYTLLPERASVLPVLKFKDVLAFFFLYLVCSLFIPSFLSLLPFFKALPHLKALGWIQIITLSLSLFLLFLYSQAINPKQLKLIWKDSHRQESQSPLKDFYLGALCWFLTFPLLSVLGYFLDLFLKAFFEFGEYEQVAVRFLKLALGDPALLAIALLTIVFIAPFVEEFLFRGILQSYLKNPLGRRAAISLSSFVFALFHLSPSQKAGNIALFVSLFAFACFLGFLYEKKGSLFAPIGLHVAFNLMSSLRVLYEGV
ncbi:MAG: hypothetical protein A2Y28_01670 [Chlamydiae bacterium GWC2_50_10]|nr:MAG: hypothetical protein A2Z85_02940 [Chlamydiae bacterium GWA2_50_15]OGN54369.1 MAG: hypothetical protein A2Y28_01670 [Chlamydiae bacterium GWC2_50_10]OGN57536.1 MAG: hypothetical protein A3D18_03490 [Chlamydiae bacterium RIFCSPHIGHO2_02_FULL_49_29]OGN71553.1 MAG: hypothetical protein A3G30_01430 [Chlamydiae bacterium RIFCSPLOWO2_12_FULL_49_12]HAZ16010.1 hypothetical protein [Parachlamydiales bacterium]